MNNSTNLQVRHHATSFGAVQDKTAGRSSLARVAVTLVGTLSRAASPVNLTPRDYPALSARVP